MRDFNLAEDVFPIGEFKKHASRLIGELKGHGRAIVVTQHGRPVGVMVTPEEYDRLRSRDRFIAAVRQGLDQAAAGQTTSDNEFLKELEAEFGPLP